MAKQEQGREDSNGSHTKEEVSLINQENAAEEDFFQRAVFSTTSRKHSTVLD